MNTTSPVIIDAFIRITGRLIAIMEQEIEHLRKMEVSEIASLQAEKNGLIDAYEEGFRKISADPKLLEALEPAIKVEMKTLVARFDAVMAENSRALEMVRNSHERLLKAIVDSVAESRARHAGYSNRGGLPQPAGGARAAHLSLTLDRQL